MLIAIGTICLIASAASSARDPLLDCKSLIPRFFAQRLGNLITIYSFRVLDPSAILAFLIIRCLYLDSFDPP